jgi:hypothetical protein
MPVFETIFHINFLLNLKNNKIKNQLMIDESLHVVLVKSLLKTTTSDIKESAEDNAEKKSLEKR